jgi:hypothetical protein
VGKKTAKSEEQRLIQQLFPVQKVLGPRFTVG